MTLDHSDNTPGREMQRMNKAQAQMRHDIRMTTADAGNDVIELTDAVTVSLVMDDNTVLDAGAGAAMRVGGEAAVFESPAVQEGGSLEAALERAAQDIARRMYAQLGDKRKAKQMMLQVFKDFCRHIDDVTPEYAIGYMAARARYLAQRKMLNELTAEQKEVTA